MCTCDIHLSKWWQASKHCSSRQVQSSTVCVCITLKLQAQHGQRQRHELTTSAVGALQFLIGSPRSSRLRSWQAYNFEAATSRLSNPFAPLGTTSNPYRKAYSINAGWKHPSPADTSFPTPLS